MHEVASPENFDLVRSILVEGKLCENIVSAFDGYVCCASFGHMAFFFFWKFAALDECPSCDTCAMSRAATILRRTTYFSELAILASCTYLQQSCQSQMQSR